MRAKPEVREAPNQAGLKSTRIPPDLSDLQQGPSHVGLETVVLDSGVGPREKLRYAHAAGRSEDLVVQLSLESLFESSGQLAVTNDPVLHLGLNIRTATCRGDGVCVHTFQFQPVGVYMPPDSTEEQYALVAAEVAPLADVRGVIELNDRGITKHADLIWPSGVSPRLFNLLDNVRSSLITVPLPDEAVGIGARWTVQRSDALGPIQMSQMVSYSLLERTGRVLRLGATLQQSATPQDVALSSNMTLKVEAYQVSGTASITVNLDGVAPRSEARTTSDLRGTVVQGDRREPLQAVGALDIVVEPNTSNVGTITPFAR